MNHHTPIGLNGVRRPSSMKIRPYPGPVCRRVEQPDARFPGPASRRG